MEKINFSKNKLRNNCDFPNSSGWLKWSIHKGQVITKQTNEEKLPPQNWQLIPKFQYITTLFVRQKVKFVLFS